MAWRTVANARQGLTARIRQPVSRVSSALTARTEVVTRPALIALLRAITVQVDLPHLQPVLCGGPFVRRLRWWYAENEGIPLQQDLQNVFPLC